MIIACADRDPTRVVVWSQRNRRNEPAFLVIDDGVKRAVREFADIAAASLAGDLVETVGPGQIHIAPSGGIVPKPDVTICGGLPTLPEWTRSLLLWGRKAVQRGVSEEPSAQLPERVKIVPCPVIRDVRIERWTPALAKKSAHTLDTIVDILVAAVTECSAAWGWKPFGLTLTFHTSDRAMGLAYSPGKGDRRISLAIRMLAAYDADSIFRTVVHELCHHAREELHPRNLRGLSRAASAYVTHDTVFCRMLAEVDTTIKSNPMACRFFNDDADPEAVAASEQKRGVVYRANAGLLEIGVSPQHHMRFRWRPMRDGAQKWVARWEIFTPDSFGELLGRFPLEDRRFIVMEWSFSRDGSGKQVGNVESFVASATGKFRSAERLKEVVG